MTDTTITSHFNLPRPSLPRTGMGASFDAIGRLIGDALIMAYVGPYETRRPPPAVFDEDLAGRDPDW